MEGNQEPLESQAAKGRMGLGSREGSVALECHCEQGQGKAENARPICSRWSMVTG